MRLSFTLFLLLLVSLAMGQAYVVRDIRSFGARGDGKTNDHDAFIRAAAFFNQRGGHGKLVISRGTYMVGKQLFNQNTTTKPVYEGLNLLEFKHVTNLTIEGESNTQIKYRDGLRFGAFHPATGLPYEHGNNYFVNYPYVARVGYAIMLEHCTNIIIRNIYLHGNNQGLIIGGVYGDTGIQIPFTGIYLVNSKKVTIDKVTSSYFGQDGIMIGNENQTPSTPDEIILKNSAFEYNSRQGLSWIGGNDLQVINSQFNHTGKVKYYSAPGAGVDIEAEVGPIKNGKFIQCSFINNTGSGVVADSGPSSNCTFVDCTFWGVTNWSLWINKPGFTIINSRVYGSFVHGYDAQTEQEATKFINTVFEDKPYKGQEPYGKFLIETNYKRRVRFEHCTMIAHKKKIVWMESNPAWKPEEKYQLINCRLVFMGGQHPEGQWVSLTRNIRYRNCSFEMYHPEAQTKRFYFNGIGEKYNVDLGGNKYFINKKEVKL